VLRLFAPSALSHYVRLVFSLNFHRRRSQLGAEFHIAAQIVQSLDDVSKSSLESVLVHLRSPVQDADLQPIRSKLRTAGAPIARADKSAGMARQ